ncbi:MAG: rhamnan synthesis F family protein [Candidatus Omnitrophota bacterium]
MLEWTGERYIPDIDPSISGAEIHYEHLHRYAFVSQYVKGKKVLDLASGEGYGSFLLSKSAESVTGIDIDLEAVKHASGVYKKNNLTFLQGSITDVPIPGEKLFDVVVCFEAIEHIEQHEILLQEIKRLITDDGILIISTPNKQAYSDIPNYHNPFHVKEIYYQDFYDLLNEKFQHVIFFGQQDYSGSSIFPVSKNSHKNTYSEFIIARELDHFSFKNDDAKVSQYFIAIASNKKIDDNILQKSFLTDISDTKSSLHQNKIHQCNQSIQSLEQTISAKNHQFAEITKNLSILQQAAATKDQQIADVNAQVQSLELAATAKDEQLVEMTAKVHFIEQQFEKISMQVECLDEKLAKKNTQLQEMAQTVIVKDQQLQEQTTRIHILEQKISSIENSIVWQLTTKFHNKIVERLLPQNTGRRKYYDLGLNGGRIFVNKGPKSLLIAMSRYHNRNHKIKQKINPPQYFKAPSDEIVSINPSEFLPVGNIKIAVQVHVYYINLFDEICTYLNNIPIPYTLFISVTSDENKKIILEKLKTMPRVEHVEIRVVQNRGRDIAPFLVEFGSSLKNFDYICHIHTKKSLYSGEEKTEWRQYLFERLLGSADTVNSILTMFKKDTSVGIIYPEIFPHISYIALTWLSNKGIAPTILNKLNIRFDPDEYLDFPVGSMFWVRKEALEPLLNLKLTINDFPEECNQNDGALQHVIERCFVLSAQSGGFRYLVIQDPTTHMFSYRSSRNLNQYYDNPFENRFMHILQYSTIISFDIFDTLLIRPFATPNMVFSYLEEIIYKEYGIKKYQALRSEAESIAREQKNYLGDVKISEIYSVFSELAKIDSETSNKLLNLEVNTETKLLIRRDNIITAAKEAKNHGKRIILISDTYLERAHIEKILFLNGIDFFDEIYLSSEIGKRKDRGDLWDFVIEREGITPRNFTHVGDNEQSDYQRIGDKGYQSLIHVMRPTALFRQSNLGSQLWDRMAPNNGWRENLVYGKIANHLCSGPNELQLFNSKQVFADPQLFGYVVFGPIIFNFMNWLIKRSIEDKCQQLWFLSRDGYLLNAAFEKIATHPNLSNIKEKHPLPKNSYFLCSRRAVVFSLLKTNKDISRLLDGMFNGSLREFFTKRIAVSSIEPIEHRLGVKTLEQHITLPEDYDSIFKYIEQVMDILVDDAQIEQKILLEYCNTQGFEKAKRIGIVDLGYSGSMQSGLMKLLNSPINGYYFVTIDKALKRSHSDSICKAYFGDFINPYDTDLSIYKYSLLLEAILTAPTGQVIRFSHDNSGKPCPIFKENGISQNEFHQISQIHEGILKFITEMIDEFGPSALDIEFPKDLVQLCYESVVSGNIDIGSLQSSLSIEDEYSGNDEISPLDFYNKKYFLRDDPDIRNRFKE